MMQWVLVDQSVKHIDSGWMFMIKVVWMINGFHVLGDGEWESSRKNTKSGSFLTVQQFQKLEIFKKTTQVKR